MTPAVRIQDEVFIPAAVGDLPAFREWALSDAFPESGRIDFLQGTIEVDMSPEELQSHGAPKSKLHAYIFGVVEAANSGQVFVDRTRLTNAAVGLSSEPDIVYVSLEALQSGRARYTEAPSKKLMEIEGTATLVVEIVSEGSVDKDLRRLPRLYAAAGVEELWLVDARGQELSFQILHLHEGDWRPARSLPDGFQESRALGRMLRFRRQPWMLPRTWQYFVDENP